MAATDVIVLSSTERPSTFTPQPLARPSDNLFERSSPCSSPLSLMSPSDLFRPSTRSKYFKASCRKDASRKSENKVPEEGVTRDNSDTASAKGDAIGEKAKQRRRQPADEPQETADSLETAGNATKKTSRPKKPRTNNTSKRGEPGNKILKGKVAKPVEKGGVPPGSSTSKGQHTSTRQSGWEGDDLQLEEALKRRLDWTPIKDTPKLVIELDDECNLENAQELTHTREFGSLLSTYNFSGAAVVVPPTQPQITEDGGPTKRRRIELVTSVAPKSAKTSLGDETSAEDTDCLVISQAGKKQKKQGKRINTLTARVTSRYANDGIEDDMVIAEEPTNSRLGRKRKSRPKVKNPDFEILSPEAAAKALDEQDLVFGTCSQLEREDSPTTLRDTQMAIRASEDSISQEYQSQSDNAPSSLRSASVSRLTTPRDLWSVAARDLDGSLIQAEALNVVDLSTASKARPGDHSSFTKEAEARQREESLATGSKDDLSRDKVPVSNGEPVPPHGETGEYNGSVESHQMPQYSGYTEAELRGQIAAYGFKPLKNRQKMIDLLQKCWESKYGAGGNTGEPSKPTLSQSQTTGRKVQAKSNTKLQAKASSKSAPSSDRGDGSKRATTTSRRKPSARNQPEPGTTSLEVEEIEDSEDEVIPSPRRQPATALQSLPTSTVPPRSPARSSLMATNPSRRTSLPDLASQITKAVRAQPHSFSSACARPSWHEKILMYDPIILEDFATWLNTEGLGLVGEDREVGTGFVREWCESKGICCCWRKGDGL